jgi:hypothetical protein
MVFATRTSENRAVASSLVLVGQRGKVDCAKVVKGKLKGPIHGFLDMLMESDFLRMFMFCASKVSAAKSAFSYT